AERAALEREMLASIPPAAAFRSRNFALLAVALSISGAALSVVLLHQITFMTDRGLGERIASWMLGATAGMGVVGKLGFGWLLDRFDQRRVAGLCFLLQSVGIGLLLLTRGPRMLALFVLVYGFAMGGNATLQATLVADCFGRAHYAAIFGRLLAFAVAFQAVAVPLAGWLRDRTGAYEPIFAALGAATLLSAIASQGLTFLRHAGGEGEVDATAPIAAG
ncbi:MAG: MFS transporter, partial [Alphaproteobacteria bacterium]